MTTQRCRRFDVGDVAILVATVVITLALTPADWFDEVGMRWVTGQPRFEPALGGDPGPRFSILDRLIWTSESLPWLWYGATLGFLGFRLRKPRPPAEDLRKQPGFVAGVIVLGIGLFQVALIAIHLIHHEGRRPPDEWSASLGNPASVVIGGWLTLWLTGQWRSEAGWIDRLGRGLGWIWIGTFLFEQIGWAINRP